MACKWLCSTAHARVHRVHANYCTTTWQSSMKCATTQLTHCAKHERMPSKIYFLGCCRFLQEKKSQTRQSLHRGVSQSLQQCSLQVCDGVQPFSLSLSRLSLSLSNYFEELSVQWNLNLIKTDLQVVASEPCSSFIECVFCSCSSLQFGGQKRP